MTTPGSRESATADTPTKIVLAIALVVYFIWRLPGLLQLPASPLLMGRYFSLWYGLPLVAFFSLGESGVKSYIFLFLIISGMEYWFRWTLIPLSYVYVWVIFLVAIIRTALTKQRLIWPYMLSPWLLAYALIAAVEFLRDPVVPTWGSEETRVGAKAYFTFFSLILSVLLMPHVFKLEHIGRLPRTVFFSALAVLAIQVGVYAANDAQTGLLFGVKPREWDLATLVEGRWSFLHQGAILLFMASLALWHAGRQSGLARRRWPYLIPALLAFVALIFTGTRAWVFGAVVVVAYILILERHYVTLAVAAGAFLLIAFFCSNIDLPPGDPLTPVVRSFALPWMNVTGSAVLRYGAKSWSWRVELWKLSIEQILRTPLLGAGFRIDAYVRAAVMSQYAAQELTYYSFLLNLAGGGTHMIWLGPFHTFGIIAGTLFLIYYFERFRAALRLVVRTARDAPDLHAATVFVASWLVYGTAIGVVDGGTLAMRFFIPAGLLHMLEYAVRLRSRTTAPAVFSPAAA